jgi:hypothetical protein
LISQHLPLHCVPNNIFNNIINRNFTPSASLSAAAAPASILLQGLKEARAKGYLAGKNSVLPVHWKV